VVSRYQVPVGSDFVQQAQRALAVLAECAGFEQGSIGQATDETELMVITTRWSSVGDYRKALSRFDVKTEVVPLLSRAVNESTAFELVHERTPTDVVDASSNRAADADSANLGSAAAPDVPPVR
jgi:hypothetical protein